MALAAFALVAAALAGLRPGPAHAEGRTILDQALRKQIDRIATGTYLALLIRDCRGTHHREPSYAHLDDVCELAGWQGDRPKRMVLEAHGRQPELLEVTFFVDMPRSPADSAPEISPGITRHPMFATSLRRGDSVLVGEARAFGIEPFEITAIPLRPDRPPHVEVRNPYPALRIDILERTWHRVFLRLTNGYDRSIRQVRFTQYPLHVGAGRQRSVMGWAAGDTLALPGEDVLYQVSLDHARGDGAEDLSPVALEITGIDFVDQGPEEPLSRAAGAVRPER